MERLIVLGLGPAGMALAHRAHQQGWTVVGIDPRTTWTNTYGLFADELPAWAAPTINATARAFPATATLASGTTVNTGRRYCVPDNRQLRAKWATFTHITDTGTIISPHEVRLSTGELLRADFLIDARGITPQGLSPQAPIQQALGAFFPHELARAAHWMDFRSVAAAGAPHLRHRATFGYAIPTPRGFVVEETQLIGSPLPWRELRTRLHARIRSYGLSPKDSHGSEKVIIPMTLPQKPHPRPGVIPFGARAGFINPVTGYSVAGSLNMIDPLLKKLASADSSPKLPWNDNAFRADQRILAAAARVLPRWDNHQLSDFLAPLLRASPQLQKGFLTMGNPASTLCGMGTVAAGVNWRQKAQTIAALLAGSGAGAAPEPGHCG